MKSATAAGLERETRLELATPTLAKPGGSSQYNEHEKRANGPYSPAGSMLSTRQLHTDQQQLLTRRNLTSASTFASTNCSRQPMALERDGAVAVTARSQAAHMNLKCTAATLCLVA